MSITQKYGHSSKLVDSTESESTESKSIEVEPVESQEDLHTPRSSYKSHVFSEPSLVQLALTAYLLTMDRSKINVKPNR